MKMELEEFERKWNDGYDDKARYKMRCIVTAIGTISANNMQVIEVVKTENGKTTSYYEVDFKLAFGDGSPVYDVATVRLGEVKEVL